MKFIFDQLTCPNCNYTEKIENMNSRQDSEMFVADLQLTPMRDFDLKVYTFICFKCNHLTNCAGKVNGDVEYFETYKFNSKEKFKAYSYDVNAFSALRMLAIDVGFDNAVKKFKKIKN